MSCSADSGAARRPCPRRSSLWLSSNSGPCWVNGPKIGTTVLLNVFFPGVKVLVLLSIASGGRGTGHLDGEGSMDGGSFTAYQHQHCYYLSLLPKPSIASITAIIILKA